MPEKPLRVSGYVSIDTRMAQHTNYAHQFYAHHTYVVMCFVTTLTAAHVTTVYSQCLYIHHVFGLCALCLSRSGAAFVSF